VATLRAVRVTVAAFGLVRGGRLDGWHFHFLRFQASADELELVARCTPPAWPFPCDIALGPYHFMRLSAIRGSRAARLPADDLIRQAYALAAIPLPSWASQQRMSLRMRLIKSRVWPWKGEPT